jgi:hypothetical protein
MKFLLADVMTTVAANRLSYSIIDYKYSAVDKYVHFGKLIYGTIQDVMYELMRNVWLRIYEDFSLKYFPLKY